MPQRTNVTIGNASIENRIRIKGGKPYSCGRPITLAEQIAAFDGKPTVKGVVVNDAAWCKRYIKQ